MCLEQYGNYQCCVIHATASRLTNESIADKLDITVGL